MKKNNEIAGVQYKENGVEKLKYIPLPKKCWGNHTATVDYIDSIMGGNDKWNRYFIKP